MTRLQLLSDLHLETENFEPEPLAGAELLVLAGDIDATWAAYSRFAGWPVPVFVVPGNHEFDGRDIGRALPAFQALCRRLGFTLLHRETALFTAADGRRLRLVGTPRWSDFDLYGPEHEMFRQTFRRFIEQEMEPNVDRWLEQHDIEPEFWLKAGESPYKTSGLPSDMPPFCAIGAGAATPRTGVCPDKPGC